MEEDAQAGGANEEDASAEDAARDWHWDVWLVIASLLPVGSVVMQSLGFKNDDNSHDVAQEVMDLKT